MDLMVDRHDMNSAGGQTIFALRREPAKDAKRDYFATLTVEQWLERETEFAEAYHNQRISLDIDDPESIMAVKHGSYWWYEHTTEPSRSVWLKDMAALTAAKAKYAYIADLERQKKSFRLQLEQQQKLNFNLVAQIADLNGTIIELKKQLAYRDEPRVKDLREIAVLTPWGPPTTAIAEKASIRTALRNGPVPGLNETGPVLSAAANALKTHLFDEFHSKCMRCNLGKLEILSQKDMHCRG
jgi:hypothetical protein